MSRNYKHQEDFAARLAASSAEGRHQHVRAVITTLKNKAQAAYIAALVCACLPEPYRKAFIESLNPNQKPERKSDHE